jgi:1-acyl-sn-glycerol-3-phosphate acyltransferase
VRSIIATVIFLLITIVLSIISLPFAVIDRSGKSYLWFARLWAKIFLVLYGIRVKVEGVRNIHKDEHYVFASNHASYADIPAILGGIPHDIRLVLRSSLTRVPIWGWALLASPMIIINRSSPGKSKQTLADAVKKINTGASVLLFPEGTRTTDGNLQPFKRGAFHLADQSGAKVLPVALIGTFDVLPRQKSMPKSNMKVTVRIGEAIVANSTLTSDREKEFDLMERTEKAVKELLTD